ncbi:MAG TPA: cation-translocating P-type ATPase [Verrucomicrobiales bacterium]|nr:cation-translocating P-type ATPase [Verrucomicrobiales bacterium]
MAHSYSHSWKPAAFRAGLCLLLYGAGCLVALFAGSAQALWLFAAACLPGGWGLVKESWEDLRAFRLEIHFLMLASAVASAALGHWPEAALLLVLFSAAEALEEYANFRTESALESLFNAAPRTALRLSEDGTVSEVPVDSLHAGMLIRIQPGQLVPVDVRISEGESECDESSLTGEAIPVGKSPGDEALGGTLNLSGLLTGEVLRPAAQSALQQIMSLIRDAQQRKAHAQRFTDRFGTRYTWLVLGGCTLLFLYWWLVTGLPAIQDNANSASAFQRAITVLIVASPCALVLSVPSAILAAIARGARMGVIFRGGSSIEDLANVNTVALDKTGTLTTGELVVEEVHAFTGDEAALRHAAFNLARQSTHPLSRAIARRFASTETVEQPGDFTNVPGSGVTGTFGGGAWYMGKRSWIQQYAPSLPPGEETERAPVHSEVWLCGPGVSGCLFLRDQPRPGVADLLTKLHQAGLRTLMLTGDRPQAAETVAKITGVQEVHAGLLPADKTALIQRLQSEGRRVAMVGDGVNDAPALTAANVGIAMGLRGSDAALEQSDLVLSRDRLDAFLDALMLSRRAVRVMRQNVFVALGMASLMVLVSIVAEIPLWLGVLTHEGSTAIVVLNSLRLLLRTGSRRESGVP